MIKESYNLASRSKEELITLINELMNKLPEKERIEFVSKWISPQEALIEAGACDGDSFIKRVEAFCRKCLDGQYYTEPDYDSYHEYYSYEDEEDTMDYSESEWAQQFTELLRISIMFARNKNYDVSFKAFETLLKCLHDAEYDEEVLGTESPMEYIDINWNEVIDEYYTSIKNQVSDEELAASKAVDFWMGFGGMGTESILNNFKDNSYIEEAIRESIADNCDCWGMQCRSYRLLKELYLKKNLEFDEIAVPKSLVSYNPNFFNYVAQGYINLKMWDEAVKTIEEAMKVVHYEPIVSALNKNLVDCFEKLNKTDEAYDVAVKMFKNNSSHELYLRARNLACKIGELNSFINNMLNFVETVRRYDSIPIMLRIMSYEGYTVDLLETALKSEGYSRHEYLKYAVKSLVYRALGDKNIKLKNLQEFIKRIEDYKIDGIIDMVRYPKEPENECILLNNSIDIFKKMVQFHINAAQRSRYARAAYYCSIINDIYAYMNEIEKFNQYYSKILAENNRRPALKDEMNKKVCFL